MKGDMLLVAAFLAFAQNPAQPSLPDLLSRVAEEAEILQQNAPKSLTQEVLEQRALMPATRFRPRIGKKATAAEPPPRLVVRQIVSEYSVGTIKESAVQNLTELRQVISVDGRKVQTVERARHALSLGITSPDDRIRKRMLEDFARYGLVDIATDYGIFLLAFNKRGQQNMKVALAGEEQIGADAAWVLSWQQTSPEGGMLEFLGNQASRVALRGRLFVRKSDGLPLRIQSWSEQPQDATSALLQTWSGHPQATQKVRDEATVDYVRSAHGFLTPASVIHRHLVDGKVVTENLYRYAPFKTFSADAEIKFTELEEPPPPPAPARK
jgi:hypothetical protein